MPWFHVGTIALPLIAMQAETWVLTTKKRDLSECRLSGVLRRMTTLMPLRPA